ncbi:zinc-dependent peptidase [Robertkochia solimangrovi]|uniref:zinc-dependent peptidase n=1 Tax=Robertkochia solimangrovi TaxID=2213046 RepID=UPI00117D3248|nr:zinc-dependent peptidase [Robertkochia solimangrovi]TRZ41870.1 hypothetical protein DMZ48_16125 [Robertkochia solimangrovi]
MISTVRYTFIDLKYRLYDLFLSKTSKAECHDVLMQWNSYFKGLGEREKKEFVIRTLRFLGSAQIESEKGFAVTREMQLLLGSAFVQITFGLNHDVLEYFNRIVLFSKNYTYKNSNIYLKGDVNPLTRSVNLSWPAIESGFKSSSDGINLALHEFAHCLILENSKKNYFQRILHPGQLKQWERLGIKQIARIRQGQTTVFRKYGGTNLMEMFAVALETFFERPLDFHADAPEFYNCMCFLLKQDPRHTENPTRILRTL